VNLTEVCIRKPVLAWMMMAATVMFGVIAISRIGISQLPDVDFPTITVTATWEGAAPDVMEREVVENVEEAVMQVEGVQSVTSVSRQGQATVTIELAIDRNVDLALQDVETVIAQAQRNLPKDLDPLIARKTNPEDRPIMWIALSGPYPPQMLSDYAKYKLQEKLQTIEGVGEVQMGGFRERNVRIWVDASKLARYQLTVADVVAAIGRQHEELPAGRIQAAGREINVRVMGEALDLDQLRDLVVRDTGDSPVKLENVALVEDGFEDERRRSRSMGFPVQGVGIKKQRGANAVAVARAVRAEVEELNQDMPEGMHADIAYDSAQYIEQSVHHVELELVMAVVLTALVCWMFLGSVSSTLNVVLAIPMSLLGTIAVIYFLHFTLNMFTLLALSLAVGLVVDDAIMVMENIYRHAEMGKGRVQAAREGTHEITFAALTATVAVIAIFMPVVFVGGIVGKYFLQFGVTLSIAVALSYVEAVTLAPSRCAQILRAGREHRSALGRLVDRAFAALGRGYRWTLARVLRWGALVLVAAGALMYIAIAQLQALPKEMVPSQDQSRLRLMVITQVGNDLDETDGIFQQAESFVNSRPEVKRTLSIVGGFGGAGVNQVIMLVTLVPPDQRALSQGDFANMLRARLRKIPGMRAVVQDPSQEGFTAHRGYPIEFSVRGPDWPTLVKEADRLERELADSKLAVDVDTDYELGMPELRITPNRARAADAGVSVDDIAQAVNALVGGIRVGKYTTGGRRLDMRLQLLRAQRSKPEDIGRLFVRSKGGGLVPLASLVKTEQLPALQSITRRDRERAITITANVAPGHAQGEVLDFVKGLGKGLPPGYRVVLGGASVAFQDSFAGLLFAFLIGVAVAYMVLASQFNSFLHPITVLTIVPLSLFGAAFALLFAHDTLNIFSMIGLLLLAGIVKKNSIILVEYANQARGRGLGAVDAMLEAGPVRLRPILMTSIATMASAVPAAIGLGAGSETRQPMAIAVIGGLVVATLLSLFVVPAFYVVADRVRNVVLRNGRIGKLGDPHAGGGGGGSDSV
jgi:multidrug efflux pump